ncbi:hypothetical protein OJAV_G00138190 [Oryzias javanicus]|uniref:Uncharacterized protein n=1 Tax=Oryzias javanicus TaxID=123683 RepID=A0A437CMJ6_ORYJA|nr:hypothetical protein OJAV_G00138190 [Oryzias javanicus]
MTSVRSEQNTKTTSFSLFKPEEEVRKRRACKLVELQIWSQFPYPLDTSVHLLHLPSQKASSGSSLPSTSTKKKDMNMKVQLFCVVLLCASLLIQCAETENSPTSSLSNTPTSPLLSTTNSSNENKATTNLIKTTVYGQIKSVPPPVKPTASASTTTPATNTNNFLSALLQEHCLQVFFVCAGLIAACTILLVSVLILACKVCHLSKKLKTLRINGELAGDSGCFVSLSENTNYKAEAETKLLTNTSQEKLEMSNSATVEEGGIANKEDGEPTATEKCDEAPPPSSEEDTSLKPQEEVTTSEPPSAAAPEPSGEAEQPKEVSE